MARRRHTSPVLGGTLLVGVLALGPAGSGGAASGQVCEGAVIDDGNGSASTQAANIAPGTSDLQALAAAGDSVAENDSGLVCAINNYPPNGLQNCLATSGSLYYYWSYWEGDPYTNTWTFAEVGPASHTVSAGQTYVQGWRFLDPGPDNATATKPSVTPAAAFAQACPGVVPVASSSGGGGSSSGSGSGTGGVTSNTSAPATAPTKPTTASAPSSPAPSSGSAGSQLAPAAKNTPARGAIGSSAPSSVTASSTSTTTSSTRTTKPASPRTGSLALSGTAHRSTSGGDPALPIVLVALLIGLLGGAAWFRWRRRPAEE